MINSVFFDELYKQFAWYDSVFTPVVKNCSSEFFYDGFEYKLESISTNMKRFRFVILLGSSRLQGQSPPFGTQCRRAAS